MARDSVQFVADKAQVKIGSGNPRGPRGGKCALLTRAGQRITTFVVWPGQERALKAGKRINITSDAIDRAETPCGYFISVPGAGGRPERHWKFETDSGLAGRRARKRSTKKRRK